MSEQAVARNGTARLALADRLQAWEGCSALSRRVPSSIR